MFSKIFKLIGSWREAVSLSGKNGLPMGLRLFLFLILFLNTIMMGVLAILFAVGVFKAGLLEHKPVLEGELAHLAGDSYRFLGSLSVQTVELAKDLSSSLERNIKEHGLSPATLQQDPQLLEHLLDEEFGRLAGALEKSRGSGVFLLLDATVNPALPNAQQSRACIYLKNMEPNIVSGTAANLRYCIGPTSIARNQGIHILPQWQMEMNVGQVPYFAEVMAVSREKQLPLSRLYRWSGATFLPASSERVMLCMVPLIASDDTVFGVCGFDVSEMLFKLSFAPNAQGYDHLFCLLSPVKDNQLELSQALFAGSFAPGPTAPQRTRMEIVPGSSGGFNSYLQPDKEDYAGLHQAISLYPTDSAYADEQWVTVLMMPQQELNTLITAKNRNLIVGLLVLMLVNIALASYISRRYISPVVAALEQLKKPSIDTKTKIPEIDDLIEFLAAQDVRYQTKQLPANEHSALYQEFMKNIKTLSAAERAVFDLYVQGHNAKEIAEILCLSINTIKTHNRRIYTKLNVTSCKELMVYVQMMEEAGYSIYK